MLSFLSLCTVFGEIVATEIFKAKTGTLSAKQMCFKNIKCCHATIDPFNNRTSNMRNDLYCLAQVFSFTFLLLRTCLDVTHFSLSLSLSQKMRWVKDSVLLDNWLVDFASREIVAPGAGRLVRSSETKDGYKPHWEKCTVGVPCQGKIHHPLVVAQVQVCLSTIV